MSGTFTSDEKTIYAFKNLIGKYTTNPKAPAWKEPNLYPRVFPNNIKKKPLIEYGVGDLNSDGYYLGTAGAIGSDYKTETFNSSTNAYETATPTLKWDLADVKTILYQYYLLDPKTNVPTNITVGTILENGGSSMLIQNKTNQNSTWETGETQVNTKNSNKLYPHFFFGKEDGTGSYSNNEERDINTYKGVRLLYNKISKLSEQNRFVALNPDTSEYIVPHISLYIRVSSVLSTRDQTKTINTDGRVDTYTYFNPFYKDLLGLESGIDVVPQEPYQNGSNKFRQIFQENELPKQGWNTEPTSGSLSFFALPATGALVTNANTPLLTYLRYIGETVDFSNLGSGGGGSGASVTVGAENEDAPTDGSKGDLFFDIDDDTLKINKDGTADGWVGVGGGGGVTNGTGLTESQVLESISTSLNGSSISPNNSYALTLSTASAKDIVTNSTNNYSTWTEQVLISSYKVPENTKQLKIKASFFITKGSQAIEADDQIIQWGIFIDDEVLINSLTYEHLDLIEKYINIETSITIGEGDTLSENKINTWNEAKEISIRARQLYSSPQAKFNYSNKYEKVIYPLLELKAIGYGIVGIGDNKKNQALESIVTSFNGSTIRTNKSGSLTFDKITSAVTTNTSSYTEITLIDSYIPPENTKSVLINYSVLLSKGWTSDRLNEEGGILEWVLVIDSQELSLSKNSIHIDLVDKYATISTIINIGDTTDYNNNKIATWTTGKKISVKCKSLFTGRNIKLHDSNDNGTIIFPTFELIASGVVSSSNLNSILKIGNAGEDPPSDGAKGELFFDIDDNKLYINKDSTSNGWVTVSSSNTASINSKIEVSEIIDGEKKIYENKWIKSEELTFAGESKYEMFGLQVDINNNFALITQFKNDSNGNPGAAIKGLHVYEKGINNWNYLYYLYHSEPIESNTFGQYPIEIKGSNIAVALNGMVFIYQLIDGNWGKSVDNQDYRVENYKLYTSDRDTNNLIPYRVTMGEKYLAISTGQELNKVYIYNFDETTGLWGIEVTGQDYRIENYIINSPQSDSRVKFGFTTSINNNYIAIGTQEQIQEKVPVPPTISYYSHGSIYIYKRNDSDGTWIQIQKLVSSYDTTHHFQKLILKDNFLIAEDSNFSENGISNGQVLVFYKNSDDTWGEAIPGNSLRYQSSILRDGTGNGNRFGNKISYNDDTLAVSSQLYTVNSIGAVYIFNRDPITGIFGLKVDGDDSYTIPNQEIINPEILPNAYSSFGFSLSISNKELLIGSYGYGDTDTMYKGKTYLYKKYSVINSDNFNGKDATIENAVIDHLVSNKLTNSNNKTVFENILSDNISQTVKDPLDNGEGQFGKDMDFSEKYMIIGSPPRENTYDGKCHIYNINNEGLLSFSKTITDPTVNSSHTTFGNAVAINDKYAVVGDYRPSSGVSGKVYIYKENNGNWSLNKEISSSDNLINAYFGIDIAINSKYIAVGASRIEGIRGAVFLYELDSAGNWGKSVDDQDYRVENYKLLPSNPINYNYFGNSIAMSEKYIVVGSYGNQTAYVYEMHSDGKWGIPVSGQTYRYENSRLKGSTITNDNTGEFGRSVATYGEYVVVGAQSKRHTTNPSDNSQGAAFIYEKINDGWIELHEIKALTSYKENFSNSIYLNDRYIIVGAMGNPFASNHDTLSPPHGGVAYIFEKNLNTGKWGNSVNGKTYMTESFKISTPSFDTKEPFSSLSNTDIRNSEYKFGWKVLINNKLIYISAPAPFNQLQYTKTEYKGIIYLFEFKNYPKLSSAVTSIGTDGILHIKSYNYPMDNTDYHWPESVILQTTVDGRQSDFLSGSLKDNGSYHNTWMDYRNILALQPHCGRVGIGVIAAKSRLHVNNDVGMANDQQAQQRGIRLSYLDKWNHYINIAYNDANSLEICANGDIGWAERGGSHGDGYGSIQLKVADKTRLKIKTHPADGDAVEITPDGPDALAKTTIKSESLTIDGVGSKIILKNRSIYDNLISIDTGNESKGCTIECTNFGTNVKKSLLLQPYGGWVGIGANDTFTYIKGRLGIGTHSDFSAPTSAYPADSKPPLNIVGPQDDSLGSSQKNTYCVLKSKTRAGFYMFHRGNYNERHMFFGLHQDSTNEVLIKSDKGTMQFWAESTIKSNKTIQVSSDNRLKHNEENIENALDTINKLNPMKYIKTNNLYSENHHFDLDISNNPLDQSGNHLSESWFREVGLIAQDILKIPELKFLVKKNEDYIDDNDNLIKNPYTVDYNSIFCYSIQAIKELDQKNKDLINKVSSLETQNSNLLTRLEALEKKINELS